MSRCTSRRALLRRLCGLGGLGAALTVTGCSLGAPDAAVPSRSPGVPVPNRMPYGDDPSQFGELHLPAGHERAAVVVVLHGGFWRAEYGMDLGTPLAADLANAGLAAWNLEYRRVGDGGGWPNTLRDVAAGVDAVAGLHERLDPRRVAVLGHSAGGQLAVWAAARHKLPGGSPGADPRVRPLGAVSQAGVLDLIGAAAANLGGGATQAFLGGDPRAVPQRYTDASPTELVPVGVPVTCVHGSADDVVPIQQSRSYVAAARAAGDDARVEEVPGGHFEQIDPSTPAWAAARRALLGLLKA